MRSTVAFRLLWLLTIAASARAQTSPSLAAADVSASSVADDKAQEVGAYCRYVRAVGHSHSALLFSPSLFATLGNVPTTALEDDESVATSRLRLQLGVSFSPTRAYRGFVTNDVADAECERYAAAARVPTSAPFSLDERRPLQSKIKVLEAAVARGRELRAQLAEQLETSLATLDDYRSLTLQLNNLEQGLAEAAGRLALLPSEVPAPAPSLIAARAASEDGLEEAQARLRRSHALELELRVGYQRTFGHEQKVPLFALGILEFAPGWLWQGPADARARSARKAWVEARSAPAEREPSEDERRNLQRALELTRARERTLSATLADLEARRAVVERVPGAEARHYADFMSLQLASLLAEQAYLNAYAEELERALARPGR